MLQAIRWREKIVTAARTFSIVLCDTIKKSNKKCGSGETVSFVPLFSYNINT